MREQQTSNSKKANIALALSSLFYLLAMWLRIQDRNDFFVQLFFTVSEASLIGGIADWFAVTALFRRPLGFPYHTALIPRNRERLVKAAAAMVQNDLLSSASIKARLSQIHLVHYLISWVEEEGGKEKLAKWTQRGFGMLVSQVNPAVWAKALESIITNQLIQWQLTPSVAKLGSAFLKQPEFEQGGNLLLEKLQAKLASPDTRRQIKAFLSEYAATQAAGKPEQPLGWLKSFFYESAKTFNLVNFDDAAAALQQELVKVAGRLADPENPLRQWFKMELEKFFAELPNQPEQQAALEAWKNDLAARCDMAGWLEEFIALLMASLPREDQPLDYKGIVKQSPVLAWFLKQLERYWNEFRGNREKQEWLERYLQEAACHIAENQHEFIGSLVQDVLGRFSDAALNALVKEQAGEDLEWVRINGSLVGGIVGLLIFLVVQFIYIPWLLPWIGRL